MNNRVVIVGAGPAGLMLACELSLAGVPATVVEHRPEPRTDSPGTAVNAGAVEALDLRGLMDRLRESTFPLPRIHFSLEFLDMAQVDDRTTNTLLLPQTLIERTLEERAAELGAEILRDHEVIGINQNDDGVSALIRTATGIRRIGCAYLVGCDGADSAVRRFAGIAWTGTQTSFYGITGDVEMALDDLPPLELGASYCPAGGQWMCAPIGPDLLRMTTAEFGIEPADQAAPVTLEEFQTAVRRLTGAELKKAKPRWLARTDCRIMQAAEYRRGRVLLAGDAACVIYPVNGQALANALHDALNLGWKLASVVSDQAPSDLLDSYHDERHPVGERACANVTAQVVLSRSAGEIGPVRDFFRDLLRLPEVNRYLAGVLSSTDTRYDLTDPDTDPAGSDPLTGSRIPSDLDVKDVHGSGELRGSLSLGHGVILHFGLGCADPAVCPVAECASGWTSRVDVIHAPPVPGIDAEVVLVRPDGHVAWASRPHDQGLRQALMTWFGTPAAAGAV
jgi:2-polyprenyl-6-methoxyphenol hydroxylase-like FAD-dependent oxidoreductase